MQTILLKRHIETGVIIELTVLDGGFEYTAVNVPDIEQREGYFAHYALDEEENIIVKYVEKPRSEIEILRDQVEEQEQTIAQLMLMLAGGVQ